MKLYTSLNNPTGRKIEAVLNHLELEAEKEILSFEKGDMQSAEYRSINPNGKIPSLVDGELKLWESNAIMMYLCTVKKPDHPLFAPRLRPQIMQWLFWESAHYTVAIRGMLYEIIVKPAFRLGEPDQQIIDHYVKEFHRFATVLEAHLEGRTFMVGDDWTLADYAIGFGEARIEKLPINLSAFPNIRAFYMRMAENPHWASTKHVS